MNALWNLIDSTDDLSTSTLDLKEAIDVANDSWDVLGDPSMYSYMTDEDAVAAWESDLRNAVMHEQWALGEFDNVVRRMHVVNLTWFDFLVRAA